MFETVQAKARRSPRKLRGYPESRANGVTHK